MADYDSMRPSLQQFGAKFLNFSSSWRSCDFRVHGMLTSPEFSAFYLRAGQGYSLVIMIAGRRQQAVHAGGNDRQPPRGTFWYCKVPCNRLVRKVSPSTSR